MRKHPDLPPIVYVPTGHHEQHTQESTVELRRTADGRTALMVYSALDRLINCCGPQQPWVLVHSENLANIYDAQPFDVIFLDAELPKELQYGYQPA